MKTLSGEEREALLRKLLLETLNGERTRGELLRSLRNEVTGLNQDQYAALVGVSRKTLSDIERDVGSPATQVLNRVFKPFGLKVGLVPRHPELLQQLLSSKAPNTDILPD